MPAVKSKRSGQLFVAVAYLVALLAAAATAHSLGGRHPILVAAAADVAATIVVFLFSIGLDNSSVYDPYWSVAPLPIAPGISVRDKSRSSRWSLSGARA